VDDDRLLGEFERHQRDLPHWEGPGEAYAIRFSVWRRVAVDLTRPDIAPLIIDALRFHDGNRYLLYDYTVMPRHVHAILKPIVRDGKAERLGELVGDLKSWTARAINRILGRRGLFWRDERYDRIIRNQAEYHEWAKYILGNAKEAGLVDDPLDWPWWGKGSGQ
jgi:hypothetical protein